MASQIGTIVNQSMRQHGLRGQAQAAAPVIRDLEAAESRVVENLIRFATARGLSRQEAERALRDAGLNVEQPQAARPAQAAQGGGDVGATLTRIEGTLNGLVAFARQNGYNG